jgi:hypothetical protein
MRIAIACLVLAACGPADKPAEKPAQPGTAQTCADICREKSPRTDDYVACLEECPGPETIGDRAPDAGLE